MKVHPALTYIVWLAIIAGLAIWLAMTHQARLRLAGEHQGLEQQLQKMAELSAWNADLSRQIAKANEPKPLAPGQLSELLRAVRWECSVGSSRRAMGRAKKTGRSTPYWRIISSG